MNRILLASLVLISASGSAIAEDLHGTLYKNQSCQCCESHAKYLRENGIDVDVVAVPNFTQISSQAGVPSALTGCHMIKLDGYVFEGHITSEILKRFLSERPKDLWFKHPRHAERGARHGGPEGGANQGLCNQEGRNPTRCNELRSSLTATQFTQRLWRSTAAMMLKEAEPPQQEDDRYRHTD